MAALPLAVCVVVLAPDKSGRVLMVQRAKPGVGDGYWTPVTGNVEPEESLQAAGVREVAEEVGLTVRLGGLLWRCPTSVRSHVLHWFLATVLDTPAGILPQVRIAPDELRDARWIQPHEVATLQPTFVDTRRFFATFADTIQAAAMRDQV